MFTSLLIEEMVATVNVLNHFQAEISILNIRQMLSFLVTF